MIDSTNKLTFRESAIQLWKLLDEESLAGKNILVMANKADAVNSIGIDEVF